MAGQKRTDNKGRILKDNETQRKDGTYRFTYTDADGKRHDVYSRRLVPTDRLPPGCKDDLSLREKERKILRDLEDGIKATVENRATLNDLFNLYISNKPELKQSTRANYLYMYKKYVQDDIGKKKISSIKYSDVKAYYNRLIRERGFLLNQRIIAGNAQFTGIAAGRGVGFTTGLLLLREGLGMRETPIRPHSWH